MMSKIEFSVEINPEKKAVARAAIELIAAMAEISLVHADNPLVPKTDLHELKVVGTEEEKPEEAPAEKPKKKNRKSTKKVEPEIEETREEEEKPAKAEKASEKAPKPAKGSEPSVFIEDIRKLMKDVVRDHRVSIKAKLTELGASSASTLAEEHFDIFYTYLETLKDE